MKTNNKEMVLVKAHVAEGEVGEIERSLCRKMKGEYYKKGDLEVENSGTCYLIDNRWYRYNTGYIAYDYFAKSYVLKRNANLKFGIVNVEVNEDGVLIFVEKYTSTSEKGIQVKAFDGSLKHLYNKELLNRELFVEDLNSNDIWIKQGLPESTHERLVTIDPVSQVYKNSLDYTVDNTMGRYIESYNDASANLKVPKLLTSTLENSIEKYSFGAEFETIKGRLPSITAKNLGVIPVRDGSVDGLEYATVPYKGAKGLYSLQRTCEALDRRTEVDDSCSLHLHIGGIPRTKEFILSLFIVLCNIQDDMYDLFPSYKKVNRGYKRKNYTKPLPALRLLSAFVLKEGNVDYNWEKLFSYLSGGQSFKNNYDSLEDVKYHPSDPRGTRKWSIRGRYHWVNLIPIIFGNKKTVEFRIHTGTNDSEKVSGYLSLCLSIISYTERFSSEILNGEMTVHSLEDMVFNSGLSSSIICEANRYRYFRQTYINHKFALGYSNPNEDDFNYTADNREFTKRYNYNIDTIDS